MESGTSCLQHHPRQHRDKKPPWCPNCGLTADFKIPRRPEEVEEAAALDIPVKYSGATVGTAKLTFEDENSVAEALKTLFEHGAVYSLSIVVDNF